MKYFKIGVGDDVSESDVEAALCWGLENDGDIEVFPASHAKAIELSVQATIRKLNAEAHAIEIQNRAKERAAAKDKPYEYKLWPHTKGPVIHGTDPPRVSPKFDNKPCPHTKQPLDCYFTSRCGPEFIDPKTCGLIKNKEKK
jgi:hypothetical protein